MLPASGYGLFQTTDSDFKVVTYDLSDQVEITDSSVVRIKGLKVGYYVLLNLLSGSLHKIEIQDNQKIGKNLGFKNGNFLTKKRRTIPILPLEIEERVLPLATSRVSAELHRTTAISSRSICQL